LALNLTIHFKSNALIGL